MERSKEMQSFAARLHTFQTAHQLSKRRASVSKKKGGGGGNVVVEWPHERPAGDELARAGFFYRPAQDSVDNVQCFLCAVKLDGWEEEDDALREHLAHSPECHWAVSLQAGIFAQSQPEEGGQEGAGQDPMSDALLLARKGTFEAVAAWPHEGKRGWKCKIAKMVEAGWCLDPAPASTGEEEEGDGVTCFYCNLSLDGWEPKDDPMEEHRRRSPGCAFFALVEKFGSGVEKKAAKGRGKKGVRGGSTASRLSTQSAVSRVSEAASFGDVEVGVGDEEAGVDDSIISTASQATTTGTTKGKKKGGRAKAAAKGAKGRKRANTVESQADAEPIYPDLSSQVQPQAMEDEEIVASSHPKGAEEPAPAPTKKTRKGTRASKAPQIDSSIIEISSLDVAPPLAKKTTRGRKAKTQSYLEPEPVADDSEVSAQLQEELERSMSLDMEEAAEMEEATPQPEPAKVKRGVKRKSDGLKKKERQDEQQRGSDVSAVVVEFPVPPEAAPAPAPAPAAKGKKGRKPSKQHAATMKSQEAESAPVAATQVEDFAMSPVSAELEAAKPTKKAAPPTKTKSKPKGRKPSSTRSSRSSKATVTAETEDEVEDLERDEREIEAELQRIAAEQASVVQAEQEKVAEFEASPSHGSARTQAQMEEREQEVQKVVEDVAGSPPEQQVQLEEKPTPMASPSGSDKENVPSSTMRAPASGKLKPTPAAPVGHPILSPSKTTRIPLAPGTPNRTLLSPSKAHHSLLSPTKSLGKLTSTTPWEAIDLDTVLLHSTSASPGTLGQRLAVAGAALASPERGLTVEEWIRLQAEKAEGELRRRCEEFVGGFEREGIRAVGVLEGVGVVG